jgi:O-acetyl-ADP-ribose deacetylase (regulator of RNase III)
MSETISRSIGGVTFEAVEGDITRQDVDAIVNAANTSLMGGGGVDGAIHRAAGPELLQECAALNGCRTGDAKITGGYYLKARHVIHTVGPVYSADSSVVPYLLASAYRSSLDLASARGLTSVAFPAISAGVYGYPLEASAEIALGTCVAFALSRATSLKLVRFVLFGEKAYQVYADSLNAFRV